MSKSDWDVYMAEDIVAIPALRKNNLLQYDFSPIFNPNL
jgi:hypothetical protein